MIFSNTFDENGKKTDRSTIGFITRAKLFINWFYLRFLKNLEIYYFSYHECCQNVPSLF